MNVLVKKSFFYSVFITLLVATFMTNQHAYAQDSKLVWQQNLTCTPKDEKYQGITYCWDTISNQNGTTSKVHVMVIDLKTSGVRFEYVLASGVNRSGQMGICQDVNRTEKGRIGCDVPNNPTLYPLIEFDDAISRFNNTAIVITADYGAGDQNKPKSEEHGPEGLTVVQRNRLDGTLMWDKDNGAVARPWLAISENPGENIKIGQLKSDSGIKPEDWIYTALGGAPWMIQNGVVTKGEITTCNAAPGSCYPEASQVAVGLSQDENWLFLAVMERPEPPSKATPTPLLDLANFMQKKCGVYKAFKLDGGGSTKLWYAGKDLYIDSGRKLSQYLVVIAEPNSGGGDGGGEDETSFWTRIWQTIQTFFKNLWAGITGRAEQWAQDRQKELEQWWQKQLADLQRKIEEWFAVQLQKWTENLLQQCCGTAIIPVSLVGLVVYQKRKRGK